MNRRILSLLAAGTLLVTARTAAAATAAPPEPGRTNRTTSTEVRLEKLVVGTNVFVNARLSRTTESDRVLVTHSEGAAGINRYLLEEDVQEKLGYVVERRARAEEVEQMETRALQQVDRVVAWAKASGLDRQVRQLIAGSLAIVLVISGAIYLFYSYCLFRICRKTGKPSVGLVWLPVLQMIPSFRAAGMSPRWFYLLFLPVCCGLLILGWYDVIPSVGTKALAGVAALSLLALSIAGIVWCFKICIACSKSGWLGLLFFIPVISYFVLPYLAFSAGGEEAEAERTTSGVKFKV